MPTYAISHLQYCDQVTNHETAITFECSCCASPFGRINVLWCGSSNIYQLSIIWYESDIWFPHHAGAIVISSIGCFCNLAPMVVVMAGEEHKYRRRDSRLKLKPSIDDCATIVSNCCSWSPNALGRTQHCVDRLSLRRNQTFCRSNTRCRYHWSYLFIYSCSVRSKVLGRGNITLWWQVFAFYLLDVLVSLFHVEVCKIFADKKTRTIWIVDRSMKYTVREQSFYCTLLVTHLGIG